jgi:hypothetical protein
LNIEKIKRNRQRKDKLKRQWYKLMSPIANYLDVRDHEKCKNNQKSAEELTDKEVINLVVKGVIKKIKKTGKLDEKITVCQKFIDYEYKYQGIYGFINSMNTYWIKNKVLNYWCWNNDRNENMEDILKLTSLLKEALKNKITGIQIEEYVDEYSSKCYWRYENYQKTIKISI